MFLIWLKGNVLLGCNHTILYYTILYYTILYYTILYYTLLYYTILYYTILYYTILYYISESRAFEIWQQQTKLVKIESDGSTTPRSATDA